MRIVMSNAGSLIQFHVHDNHEVLNKLSDSNGILYYQGAPMLLAISKKPNNGITLEPDGLYVGHDATITDAEVQQAIIDTLAILRGAAPLGP